MKKTLEKIMALVLCLSLSVLTLTACNVNGNEPSTSSSSSSSKKATIEDIQNEVRVNYTAENMQNIVLEASLYDVMYGQDKQNQMFNGFLLGDVYNMVIDEVNALINAQQGGNGAGLNLSIFKFSRDTQGNWRNTNKADVHPIMNKLLNFNLDGSNELVLTENELKTYGEVKLFDILRYSVSNTKVMFDNQVVQEANESLTSTLDKTLDAMYKSLDYPVLTQTLNMAIADFVKVLGSNSAERFATLNKVYGDIKLGEFAPYFGTTLPQEIGELELSLFIAELESINEMGFAPYFQANFMPQIEAATNALTSMTMGELMQNFGIVLPKNLAKYTVGQVVMELQQAFAPNQGESNTPSEPSVVETTPDGTQEPQASTFMQELQEYLMGLTVYTSNDGTITLKGEELFAYIEEGMQILATDNGANITEILNNKIAAFNDYVTRYDAYFMNFVNALEKDGLTLTVNAQTLTPTQVYANIKAFLSKGESYNEFMAMFTGVKIQALVEGYGYVVPTTGVEKVDDFIKKYMSLTMAEFIDASTFVIDYDQLVASLTLSDMVKLYGYSYIEQNEAVKTFMGKYGNMTQAELSAVDQVVYSQDMIELLKGLKVKELLGAQVK